MGRSRHRNSSTNSHNDLMSHRSKNLATVLSFGPRTCTHTTSSQTLQTHVFQTSEGALTAAASPPRARCSPCATPRVRHARRHRCPPPARCAGDRGGSPSCGSAALRAAPAGSGGRAGRPDRRRAAGREDEGDSLGRGGRGGGVSQRACARGRQRVDLPCKCRRSYRARPGVGSAPWG